MNLIISILIISLLLSNIKLSNRGRRFYWFFELSHFLMGFLIASFISTFLTNNLLIILVVMAISVSWEFWEYIATKSSRINNFIKKLNYYIDKENFKDILLDLILDLSGVVVFIILRFSLT